MIINGTVEREPRGCSAFILEKLKKHSPVSFLFWPIPNTKSTCTVQKQRLVIINDAQELKEPVEATLIKGGRCLFSICNPAGKIPGNGYANKLTGIQEPSYISKSARLWSTVFILAPFRISAKT